MVTLTLTLTLTRPLRLSRAALPRSLIRSRAPHSRVFSAASASGVHVQQQQARNHVLARVARVAGGVVGICVVGYNALWVFRVRVGEQAFQRVHPSYAGTPTQSNERKRERMFLKALLSDAPIGPVFVQGADKSQLSEFILSIASDRSATVMIDLQLFRNSSSTDIAQALSNAFSVHCVQIRRKLHELLQFLKEPSPEILNTQALDDVAVILQTATRALEQIKAMDPDQHLPPVIFVEGCLESLCDPSDTSARAQIWRMFHTWCMEVSYHRRLAHVVLTRPLQNAVNEPTGRSPVLHVLTLADINDSDAESYLARKIVSELIEPFVAQTLHNSQEVGDPPEPVTDHPLVRRQVLIATQLLGGDLVSLSELFEIVKADLRALNHTQKLDATNIAVLEKSFSEALQTLIKRHWQRPIQALCETFEATDVTLTCDSSKGPVHAAASRVRAVQALQQLALQGSLPLDTFVRELLAGDKEAFSRFQERGVVRIRVRGGKNTLVTLSGGDDLMSQLEVTCGSEIVCRALQLLLVSDDSPASTYMRDVAYTNAILKNTADPVLIDALVREREGTLQTIMDKSQGVSTEDEVSEAWQDLKKWRSLKRKIEAVLCNFLTKNPSSGVWREMLSSIPSSVGILQGSSIHAHSMNPLPQPQPLSPPHVPSANILALRARLLSSLLRSVSAAQGPLSARDVQRILACVGATYTEQDVESCLEQQANAKTGVSRRGIDAQDLLIRLEMKFPIEDTPTQPTQRVSTTEEIYTDAVHSVPSEEGLPNTHDNSI